MASEKKTVMCRIMYILILVISSLPIVCTDELERRGAFRIFMFVVQVGTLFTVKIMFERMFTEKLAAVFGVLFYMLCPYRRWLCYAEADFGRCVAWMLLPLFIWGMAGLYSHGLQWKEVLVASVAFAGIGYADNVMFLITGGMTLLSLLWYQRAAFSLPLGLGSVLYMPGIVSLFRYLLFGEVAYGDVPLTGIMSKGYTLGEFFSSYVYRPGHPGLGLGLLGANLIMLWLCITKSDLKLPKKFHFWAVSAVLLLWFSLSCFPWDILQRVGMPFLRLIAMIESPNVFFGCACIILCMSAAYAMECLVSIAFSGKEC